MKIKFLLCMALAIALFSCGKDDEPWNDDANGQSNNSSVVINADGSTSTGAPFSMLDGTTFYLDYIKYQIVDSHLEIVGYDPVEITDDVRPYAQVTLNGTKYNTRVIAQRAFSLCHKMKNIEIPNSVTTIDNSAFSSCMNLKKVEIPNSVEWIGEYAFMRCGELSEIEIPTSVRAINENAFTDCTSLKELEIPESVDYIGNSAFSGCTGLIEIKIHGRMELIEGEFFGEVEEVPVYSPSISDYAFSGCINLKKIILPETISTFHWNMFNGCDSLSDVYLGKFFYTSAEFYPIHNGTITFHVKSECLEDMTRILNPYERDNIIVIGDYSSSIK